MAHIRYAFSICAWFAIFAAWYYWFPRKSGRAYAEVWARLHFWATLVGASLLLLSRSVPALGPMPRRYADLTDAPVSWFYVASAGSYITAVGVLFLLVSVPWPLRRAKADRKQAAMKPTIAVPAIPIWLYSAPRAATSRPCPDSRLRTISMCWRSS